MLRSKFLWKLYTGFALVILMTAAIVGFLVGGFVERETLAEVEQIPEHEPGAGAGEGEQAGHGVVHRDEERLAARRVQHEQHGDPLDREGGAHHLPGGVATVEGEGPGDRGPRVAAHHQAL